MKSKHMSFNYGWSRIQISWAASKWAAFLMWTRGGDTGTEKQGAETHVWACGHIYTCTHTHVHTWRGERGKYT